MPCTDTKAVGKALLDLWTNLEPGGGIVEGTFEGIPSGYEATAFSAVATLRDGTTTGLIIKLYPDTAPDTDARALAEFRALRALASRLPVPKAYAMVPSATTTLGGPWLLMERVGEYGMWQALNSTDAEGKVSLARGFADAMRRMHDLDWRGMGVEPDFDASDPYGCQGHSIDMGFRILASREDGRELLPVLEWMRDNYRAYPCRKYALVHNDLHPANVMTDGSGTLRIIDWTNARIDDPRIDVAWTYATMVCHPWFNEAFMDRYGPEGGMDYFLAVGCLKKVYGIVQPLADPEARARLLPHARESMLACGPQVRACYDTLRGITGVGLPSVERFIGESTTREGR